MLVTRRSESICKEATMKRTREPPTVTLSQAVEKLLTYDGLEQKYGIKKGTAYSLVCRKRIPHIRLGKRFVRFPVDEIDRWFAEHFVAVSPPPSRAVA